MKSINIIAFLKKNTIRCIGWLIGTVALVIFLTYYFNWSSFRQEISGANIGLIGIACFFYIIGIIFRSLRWTYIVGAHHPLSYFQGYNAVMISNMINFFFPLRIGEIIRLIIVKRTGHVTYSASSAASIIEKLTHFLIILCYLILAPLAGFAFTNWFTKFISLLFGIIFIAMIFLIFGSATIDRFKTISYRLLSAFKINEDQIQWIFSSRFVTYLENTFRQCQVSAYTGFSFIMIIFLGIAILSLDGLANFFLLSAFGLEISFLQATIAACFFNVLFLLPSPPMQLGTAEMYPILIYSVGLNLSETVIATTAIVWHMLLMIIVALLGTFAIYSIGFRLSNIVHLTHTKINPDEIRQ
jgi:uncharacterized protein (TIRG00374 family)